MAVASTSTGRKRRGRPCDCRGAGLRFPAFRAWPRATVRRRGPFDVFCRRPPLHHGPATRLAGPSGARRVNGRPMTWPVSMQHSHSAMRTGGPAGTFGQRRPGRLVRPGAAGRRSVSGAGGLSPRPDPTSKPAAHLGTGSNADRWPRTRYSEAVTSADTLESRAKSSRTSAISFWRRGSWASGVVAKSVSR